MTTTATMQSRSCASRLRAGALVRRSLAALPVAAALVALQAVAAQAGPCLPINQKLLPLPEIKSDAKTHVLKGTILLTREERRLILRAPGTPPGQPGVVCQPQPAGA